MPLLSAGQRDQVVERMSDHVLGRFAAATAGSATTQRRRGRGASSWTPADSPHRADVQDREDG